MPWTRKEHKETRGRVGIIGLLAAVVLALLACAPGQITTPGRPASGAQTQPTQDVAGARGTPLPRVSGTTRVMGVWGSEELDAFRQVMSNWERETGGRVEFESTRDLSAVLRARVDGRNPPDIAILPNPALMEVFARNGSLKALDQVLDISQLRRDYGQVWLDLGTVNGQLYGLFVKASTKDTVWYSPNRFRGKGYQVPGTWDDLIELSNQMVRDNRTPWSMGMESGSATGWPGSDWIQEIYLHQFGPDMYDRWVRHQIPWTDPSVRAAFERFGAIALTRGYVPGGVENILATNFTDASYLPFMDPPRTHMYFLGAFVQIFLQQQFPALQAGQDYDFFPFPTVDEQYAGAVTGGGDIAVMFTENQAARSFMQYMALARAWEPWARRGGFSSPNRSFDLSLYPDPVAQKLARQLTEARIFRFDADDLMPAQVQQAEWRAILDYLRNPGQLDRILQNVENVARDAYRQRP